MRRVAKAGVIGAAAGLALFGAFVWVMQAAAVSGSLIVYNGSAEPGDQGEVDLVSIVPEPGLGAWSVNVTYDPAIINAVDCASDAVCNPEYSDDSVRSVGAVVGGLIDTNTLATITFECLATGQSPLTLTIDTFADATTGEPQEIDTAITDGTFTCDVEPTETPEATSEPQPTPTARPTTVLAEKECSDFKYQEDAQAELKDNPGLDSDKDGAACDDLPHRPSTTVLPDAGNGGPGWPGGLSPQAWLIAGLAGAGIAWFIAGMAGAGMATANAVNRRRNRDDDVGMPHPRDKASAETPCLLPTNRPASWISNARYIGWWKRR